MKIGRNRKGISGIVATALLLTSVTILGTSMVTWSNGNLKAFETSLVTTSTNMTNQINENLVIENVAFCNNCGPSNSQNVTNVTITNTGTVPVKVTQVQINGVVVSSYYYSTSTPYSSKSCPLTSFATSDSGRKVTTNGAVASGTITITQPLTLKSSATLTLSTPSISGAGSGLTVPRSGQSITATVSPSSGSNTVYTITISVPFSTSATITNVNLGTIIVPFRTGTVQTSDPTLAGTTASSSPSGVLSGTATDSASHPSPCLPSTIFPNNSYLVSASLPTKWISQNVYNIAVTTARGSIITTQAAPS